MSINSDRLRRIIREAVSGVKRTKKRTFEALGAGDKDFQAFLQELRGVGVRNIEVASYESGKNAEVVCYAPTRIQVKVEDGVWVVDDYEADIGL